MRRTDAECRGAASRHHAPPQGRGLTLPLGETLPCTWPGHMPYRATVWTWFDHRPDDPQPVHPQTGGSTRPAEPQEVNDWLQDRDWPDCQDQRRRGAGAGLYAGRRRRLPGDSRRPVRGAAAHRARQFGRGGQRRLGGARPGRHRAACRSAGAGRQSRAVQEVRRDRRVAAVPGCPRSAGDGALYQRDGTRRSWPPAAATSRTRSTTCWPSRASSAACSMAGPRN
jgi:hypothetical protein